MLDVSLRSYSDRAITPVRCEYCIGSVCPVRTVGHRCHAPLASGIDEQSGIADCIWRGFPTVTREEIFARDLLSAVR